MNLGLLTAKLKALRDAVESRISNPQWRYLDPQNTLDLFERYEPHRDALGEGLPDVFGDLPVRPRPVSSGTTDHEGRGFILRQYVEQLLQDIEYCLRLIDELPTDADIGARVTREGLYLPGQQFDAIMAIREVTGLMKSDLLLIDGYIDESILKLLAGKPDGATARILTREVSGPTEVAATAFNKQHGNLFMRLSTEFHDRFVIVDGSECFHFGASLKDAGARGFMFSRIEEDLIVRSLVDAAERAWASAKIAVAP